MGTSPICLPGYLTAESKKQAVCCLVSQLRGVLDRVCRRALRIPCEDMQPLLSTAAEVNASRLRSVPVPGTLVPHRMPEVQMSL